MKPHIHQCQNRAHTPSRLRQSLRLLPVGPRAEQCKTSEDLTTWSSLFLRLVDCSLCFTAQYFCESQLNTVIVICTKHVVIYRVNEVLPILHLSELFRIENYSHHHHHQIHARSPTPSKILFHKGMNLCWTNEETSTLKAFISLMVLVTSIHLLIRHMLFTITELPWLHIRCEHQLPACD